MFIAIPKGFFPTEDTGFLSGSTEVAPDTAFPVQAELAQRVVAIVMKDPAVDYVTASVGSGGASNQGSIFVALKPKAERGDIQAVISRLRRATTQVPGVNSDLRARAEHEPFGRPAGARGLSVHASVGRPDLALRQVAATARPHAPVAATARRLDGPADPQPPARDRHRPREGRGLRRHVRADPRGALQHLWRPADLDDLHAIGRLSGHPRRQQELPGTTRPRSAASTSAPTRAP